MNFNFAGTKYVQTLKWIATILPAIGALYLGIATTLGLPMGNEVVGICMTLETFVMVLVGLAKPEETEV